MSWKSEKQRKAAMANLRGANKRRQDAAYERHGGPVSAMEAAAIQSKRGAAGSQDAHRTSQSVVRAGSKRSAMWRGNPNRFDMAGVDTNRKAAKPKARKTAVGFVATGDPYKQHYRRECKVKGCGYATPWTHSGPDAVGASYGHTHDRPARVNDWLVQGVLERTLVEAQAGPRRKA